MTQMNASPDTSKTLQELDGQDWGEPSYDSYVARNSHRLRRVPIRDFTAEDLRLMLGQEIGLEYLVPEALRRLMDDPFLAGDFGPGDLLKNILSVPQAFWDEQPELGNQATSIAALALERLGDATSPNAGAVPEALRAWLDAWMQPRRTPRRDISEA